jgi:hypothetical protein
LSKYHARFAIFISMIIAAAATAAAPNLSSQGLLAAGQKSCLSAAIYLDISMLTARRKRNCDF